MVISSLAAARFGEGEWMSILEKYGCLWGRGEMSILSSNPPGEEEGRGGVVTKSVKGQHCTSPTSDISLTPTIKSTKEVRCEEGPPRCGQLRAAINVSTVCKRIFTDPGIPHIDVEVLGEIGRQTSCGRRSTNGLHGKVIWLARSLHAEVTEVESTRSKVSHAGDVSVWVRDIIVSSPRLHKIGRLHGSQR